LAAAPQLGWEEDGRSDVCVCGGRAAHGAAGRDLTPLLPGEEPSIGTAWYRWRSSLGHGCSGDVQFMQDRHRETWSGNRQLKEWSCWSPRLRAQRDPRGTARCVVAEGTQPRASQRLLLWCCALGRVNFAL